MKLAGSGPRLALVLTVGLAVGPAEAGQSTPVDGGPAPPTAATAPPGLPLDFDGPPLPIAPEVISRDAAGRVTIRAVRVDAPLRIDGALDEALYRDVPSFSGFIQIDPHPGDLATEQTDAWLAFDNDNVYVSVRAWDSQMDRLVATEMRRDSIIIFTGDDVVSFMFDTFYDRRNSLTFKINPLAGVQDGQVTNELVFSPDWNPVWTVKTGRFDKGWTIEAAIPFKSLRYRAGTSQIWGFNMMRIKRSKNEVSFLTRLSPARGPRAMQQASLAATVVGLEAPAGGGKLDLKPFATSNLTTDGRAVPRVSNDLGAHAGLDAKYAVTQNLTADVTYNTDFAQVEADEQQVNLTRFSLFFPEKREFFLENQGTFAFGGVALTGGNQTSADAPILFYSRRIGLNRGYQVPLQVGGRLTGRAGRYNVGVLNIQTGHEPQTGTEPSNFSVVRVKRDLLRRSSVGFIATNRSAGQSGRGTNQAYGVDGTFAFFDNLYISTYWARTRTDGLRGDDASYRGQLDYTGDRYGVQLERIAIGDNFNPEVGFVRRDDMVRDSAQFRFSPRPRSMPSIRKFSYTGTLAYVKDRAGVLESREGEAEFAIEFQNADRFSAGYSDQYEFLPLPFAIAPGVTLPVGGYDFETWRLGFNTGRQRRLASNLLVEYGPFYNGHRTAFTATQGRVSLTNQLSAEPTYSLNTVDLAHGSFTTHLVGSRVTYTITPLMFVSALLQYSSSSNAVSTNARLRWEYQPGSELFVVYSEERNTLARSYPSLSNRALIVKVNRLFRF